jgi:MATE family multidrug resistance protein
MTIEIIDTPPFRTIKAFGGTHMAIEASAIGAGLDPAVAERPTATASVQPSLQRRVVGLAGPVIGENLLETMLGIVDTVLVARLGATATAGVGSAQQLMFFLIAALSALAIGSAVLVAQAVGAGDTQRASRLARQSLIWSALLSIPLAIGGLLLARPIVGMYGLVPEAAVISVSYLHVTMGTVVVLVALFIGGGVLRGTGDSRTPMRVTAIANLVNVALAYALIYGHFGLPALGPVGSAWATFLARSLALALLVAALWRGRSGVTISGRHGWRPNVGVVRSVLKIGVPAALEQVLIAAGFVTLAIVVARLGTVTLAAHQIAFVALSFSFLPGIGFGIAATTLVGQSLGARRMDEGALAVRIAMRWAVGWMSVIGAIVLIFAQPIMQLFTVDPAVIEVGAAGLRIVALAQPFWAVLLVYAGALRGTGNTRFPLIATGGALWLSVGLAYALLASVGGGLIAVWAAFLAIAPAQAVIYRWRWRRAVREYRT